MFVENNKGALYVIPQQILGQTRRNLSATPVGHFGSPTKILMTRKRSEMILNILNDPKRSETIQNDPKGSQMILNDPERSETIRNDPK